MTNYKFMVRGVDKIDCSTVTIDCNIEYPGCDMIRVLGVDNVERMLTEKLHEEYPSYELDDHCLISMR